MREGYIYLDNAATTQVCVPAIQAMVKVMEGWDGNPSSIHVLGGRAEEVVESARSQLLSDMELSSWKLFFTSGATEGNNWAISTSLRQRKRRGKKILCPATAHPSILERFRDAESQGFKAVFLKVDSTGSVLPEELEEHLTDDVILFSTLWVNNETGVIHPIKEWAQLIRKRCPHCLIHVDGVQGVLKIPGLLDFEKDIDFFTISAHKLHGPKGVGALLSKNEDSLFPLIMGGGQERGLRSGTENVAGIVGFQKAFSMEKQRYNVGFSRVADFQKKIENEVVKAFPDVKINGKGASRSPYISSFAFPSVRGEVLVHALADLGLITSTGSACSSKKDVHSSVLESMGLEKEFLDGALRISYSPDSVLEKPSVIVGNLKKALKALMPVMRKRYGK